MDARHALVWPDDLRDDCTHRPPVGGLCGKEDTDEPADARIGGAAPNRAASTETNGASPVGACSERAPARRWAIISRPALAQEGDNLPPSIPEWQLQPGEETLSHPYGRPSKFEADVVRRYRHGSPEPATRLSSFSLTPLQDLHGIITPNGLHYERHHGGVPAIDPSEHRLMVHGLVERPLIFSVEDLMRFPSVSRVHFLECSGNTQNWGAPKPELTAQDTHGLLSCCEWTGVPLATVLAEAGVKPEAKWMLAEGADAAAMTRSIPIEKALDDALLAYAQNGERLRPEQGYPLRLLLPGYEGNTNVKWLRRLKLGAEPFQTREETSKYTHAHAGRRGAPVQFRHGSEIGHHLSVRRAAARGAWILRDLRRRLVWIRKGRPRRSDDGQRRVLARRRAAGADPVQVPDPISRTLELGRRVGDAGKPRH